MAPMEQVVNTNGKTVDVMSRNHWDAVKWSVTRWFLYVGILALTSGAVLYARVTDQVNANTAELASAGGGMARILAATQVIQTQLDSLRIEMRHLTPKGDR